ncbi:hypothetical protein AVEN_146516-1 [Araneus ventricosus]|uniref:Uncharacterized protein n=1 Tax=Araneus ventricosus TaxID=182803 RepID=A0A4Y2MH60_ARAVE|nr:hypothetical protein AVEN_146516-1 [Araneus ventricosus]
MVCSFPIAQRRNHLPQPFLHKGGKIRRKWSKQLLQQNAASFINLTRSKSQPRAQYTWKATEFVLFPLSCLSVINPLKFETRPCFFRYRVIVGITVLVRLDGNEIKDALVIF